MHIFNQLSRSCLKSKTNSELDSATLTFLRAKGTRPLSLLKHWTGDKEITSHYTALMYWRNDTIGADFERFDDVWIKPLNDRLSTASNSEDRLSRLRDVALSRTGWPPTIVKSFSTNRSRNLCFSPRTPPSAMRWACAYYNVYVVQML